PARANDAEAFLVRMRHADGHWVPLDVVVTNRLADPELGGLVMNMRDVTERQQAELELRRAQKLESVGRLAAGLPPEITTPIQFIGDNLLFLRSAAEQGFAALRHGDGRLPQEDLAMLKAEVPQAIEQSLEGVRRVASVVAALREFARAD